MTVEFLIILRQGTQPKQFHQTKKTKQTNSHAIFATFSKGDTISTRQRVEPDTDKSDKLIE